MVKEPQYQDVEVEIEGQRHQGHYTIDHGIITVWHLPFGASKSTQLGARGPGGAIGLARMLLRELVAEAPPRLPE